MQKPFNSIPAYCWQGSPARWTDGSVAQQIGALREVAMADAVERLTQAAEAVVDHTISTDELYRRLQALRDAAEACHHWSKT